MSVIRPLYCFFLLSLVLLVVPLKGSDRIILTASLVEENLPAHQLVGQLQCSLWNSEREWRIDPVGPFPFYLSGDSILTTAPLDYESDSLYLFQVGLWQEDSLLSSEEMVIVVANVEGKFDQNGVADSAVAARYPGVKEGDFLFMNTNTAGRNIHYGAGFGRVSFPARIWVLAGEYDEIILRLDSVSGNSPTEPVIISNLLGQVRARKVLLEGGSNWRLTGQFDPEKEIGDAGFTGCDQHGSTVDFGYSNGRFGWWIANQYTNEEVGLAISGGATGVEIDHIEISDGGFAGLMIKSKSDSRDMEDIHLHHLYIHDVGGEGMYLGSTEPDPQHQINRLVVEFCAVLRTGAEAIQAGQLGPGCLIQHNVLWGGLDWMSPFALHQDHGVQLAIRKGGTTFRNNVILGSGNAFFNIQMTPLTGDTPNGDSLIIRNNICWQVRGPLGAYMAENTDGQTPVLWRSNYFGAFHYDYDRVYTARPDSDHIIRVASLGIPVGFRDNVYDDSRDKLYRKWSLSTATIVDMGQYQHAIPEPVFSDFIGMKANYLGWHHYAEVIGEDSGFPASNTRKGEFVRYEPGEVVSMAVDGRTRFYQCLQESEGVAPDPEGNEFWELLTWTDGNLEQNIPPDDVRMDTASFYYRRNMGLEPVSVVPDDLILTAPGSTGFQDLEVFPNPSEGMFYISPPREGGKSQLQIYSPEGRMLLREEVSGSSHLVDLGTASSGLYLITLEQDNHRYTRRVFLK